jgi:hypothetical protein
MRRAPRVRTAVGTQTTDEDFEETLPPAPPPREDSGRLRIKGIQLPDETVEVPRVLFLPPIVPPILDELPSFQREHGKLLEEVPDHIDIFQVFPVPVPRFEKNIVRVLHQVPEALLNRNAFIRAS